MNTKIYQNPEAQSQAASIIPTFVLLDNLDNSLGLLEESLAILTERLLWVSKTPVEMTECGNEVKEKESQSSELIKRLESKVQRAIRLNNQVTYILRNLEV
jgi:hypothetical protein